MAKANKANVPPPGRRPLQTVSPWVWACLLALLTFLVYYPSIFGAVLWDDSGHVTKPELRSFIGLLRIWFEVGASQQYYPVLHTAFWVEHRLWGDATLGYHLVNILLHSCSACLLAVVLGRLAAGKVGPEAAPGTAAGSALPTTSRLPWPWLAAFLFALHPVCVESVAWISEQKNTLSTVFYLLAALAYLRFEDGARDAAARRPEGTYWLATLFFFLALMSKTVTATLPAALLVALWWRKGKLSLKRDVLPLIPWFALGGALGLFTAWVERHVIGAEGGEFELSLAQRGLVAGRVIWFYLGKLLWPADLIFSYPHWNIDAGQVWQFLFPAGVFILLVLLWLPIRRQGSHPASRAPLAGFLFFSGTLFPVLGFFSIYPFRFSYVADHFQYLASMGIISALAAGWGLLRTRNAGWGYVPPALLCLLGVLSWRQSHMYTDAETLFRTTIEHNPGSWMAENNLGDLLFKVPGPLNPEALVHFRRAVQLNRDYAQGHNNVGSALTKIPGRLSEAIAELELANRLNPAYAEARNNLGLALAQAGRLDEAEAQFREAIRIDRSYPEAHVDLGITLGETGRLDQALVEFRKAVEIKPDLEPAHKNLGVALLRSRNVRAALAEFEEAHRLDPDDPEVNRTIQVIQQHLGSFDGQ